MYWASKSWRDLYVSMCVCVSRYIFTCYAAAASVTLIYRRNLYPTTHSTRDLVLLRTLHIMSVKVCQQRSESFPKSIRPPHLTTCFKSNTSMPAHHSHSLTTPTFLPTHSPWQAADRSQASTSSANTWPHPAPYSHRDGYNTGEKEFT